MKIANEKYFKNLIVINTTYNKVQHFCVFTALSLVTLMELNFAGLGLNKRGIREMKSPRNDKILQILQCAKFNPCGS